jgi:cell division septal protein FtsQ
VTKASELRRADVVRNRRRDNTQKRLSESAVLATRPLAPITARRSSTVGPSMRPVPSRVRRRASHPLKMPGIQVHLPSIEFRSPQVKWRLLSSLLSLLLGAAIYGAWTLPDFRVVLPRVSGNQGISADEIRAVMGSSGQFSFSLVPTDLEIRLRRNFPELLAAHVSVGLPNDVSVAVSERTPSILWQQGDAYTWIDDSGVAFRPRGTAAHLITVTALTAPEPGTKANTDPFAPVPYLSADLVNSIKMLAAQAPPGTSMLFDSRYGLGWSDARGWQAFFGTGAREMSLRLLVYQSLVSTLQGRGIAPVFINVQFPTAPYYRMNQ